MAPKRKQGASGSAQAGAVDGSDTEKASRTSTKKTKTSRAARGQSQTSNNGEIRRSNRNKKGEGTSDLFELDSKGRRVPLDSVAEDDEPTSATKPSPLTPAESEKRDDTTKTPKSGKEAAPDQESSAEVQETGDNDAPRGTSAITTVEGASRPIEGDSKEQRDGQKQDENDAEEGAENNNGTTTSKPRPPTPAGEVPASTDISEQDENRKAWNDLLDEVLEAEVGRSTQAAFQKLHESAMELGENFRCVDLPATEGPIANFDEYLDSAKLSVYAVWNEYVRQRWNDTLQEYEDTPDDRRKLEELFTEMESKSGDGPLQKPAPIYIWKLEWHHVTSRVVGEGSLATRGRYHDVLKEIEKNHDGFSRRIDVIEGWEKYKINEIIELMWEALKEDRRLRVVGDWNRRLAALAEEGDAHTRLYLAMLAMEQAVERGQEAYGPEEEPSEPLPPDAIARDVLGFDGDRTGVTTGDWLYETTLGVGAFGHAALWMSYDDGGAVADRIVIKESYLKDAWDRQVHWHESVTDRVPAEYFYMKHLSDLPNSSHIVGCPAHGIYEVRQMYRVLMEYCPHGNLEYVIRRTERVQEAKKKRTVALFLPDRFLWSVFEAIVSACCLMQLGHMPGIDPPESENKILLHHRDLKPSNIFLSTPDDTYWPKIPVSKVGDFGLTIRDDDPASKDRSIGTPGYIAPEHNHAESPHEPSIKSDTWNIGRIMLSLMNLENDKSLKTDPDDGAVDGRPAARPGVAERYRDLYDMVMQCLDPDPGARMDIQDLWRNIQDEVTKRSGLGKAMNVKPGEKNEMRMWKGDMYADLAS